MATQGTTFVLETETSPDVWKPLAVPAGQFPEVEQRRPERDVTCHGDSSLPWRVFFPAGLWDGVAFDLTVMKGKSADNETALTYVLGKIADTAGIKLRIRDTSGGGTVHFEGTFLVLGARLAAPLEGEVTYVFRMQMTGAPTTHLGS